MPPCDHNSAAVGGKGTGAAIVICRVANNTEGGVADQRAAVAADPRAGVEADAADCSAVGSPPVRPQYSCPAAADSADAAVVGGAVVGDGRVVAADSADAAVVGGAVVGDGRVDLRLFLLLCWMLWFPGSCCRPSLTVLRRQVLVGFEQ